MSPTTLLKRYIILAFIPQVNINKNKQTRKKQRDKNTYQLY